MEPQEFAERHPLLFHVAAAGAWPSIRDHGLLPARGLVESGGFDAGVADATLRRPRPTAIALDHPAFGRVVLRDQAPLRLPLLEPRLDGVTVGEWLQILAERVFLWPHPARVARLLGTRRARAALHDVVVVDTESLLAAHGGRVELSPINSGAALWPNAPRRGRHTFAAITDYPYAERRLTRGPVGVVAEVAIPGAVLDIRDHVLRVERRCGPDVLHELPR